MSQLATRRESASDVAIVGMSCILPGRIDSTELLWKFLCDGGDAITEVPSTRWNTQAVYDPDPLVPGKTISRWGGFVHDIAAFDAGFFGISPREAAVMDPQQRMLLEATWRAFEDAGFQVERLAGSRTGVYVGISYCDYNAIQRVGRDEVDVHTSTGSALSIAANRLSHRFDLRGPSLSIDTACSSSMVALDAACAALKSGECDLAVVGGVNAILTPDVTITFSRASMLSPDGRCKSFDSSANGYVRSEGAGVVVLKPLARARADGDRIHAIVLATAVNQDGRTETITVPNVNAQMALLQDVCRRGAIDPSHVRYVEAHGTGTPVGDPIEAEAIGAVFGRRGSGDGDDPCLLGSIKSNIGHLEPAAGIAGLIKATLCVEMGQIPPSLHFETPNPNIRFRELGIEVAATLRPFPETGLPRLAAVNSFGFGGTNACAIVQQAPAFSGSTRVERDQTWPVLLPISAVSEPALAAAASRLADSLENGISLADAAGTLAMRRSHLDYRAVASATSISDAVTSLRAFARGPVPEVVSGCRTRQPQMAFVFTGQGAQWWGMGRGLLERDPDFREAIETCDRIFARRAGWSLLEELAASRECAHKDPTFVAQPTLFALQVGLAARWKAWGVKPAAVIGHSVGEIAAAYVCGALSLEDALAVVYHRSRLQERARLQGGMAAIGLAPQDAQRLIEENRLDLEVAAVNAQELVTVAGPRQDIERLLGKLRNNGSSHVFGQLLNVDYAFHSRQMDPFEQELRASLREIVSAQPSVPMFSTVSGSRVNANDLTADYWWRNMRQPVLFQTGIEALIDAGLDTFLELGPHATLSGPIRDCLARSGRDGIAIASLQREVDDQKTITAAAAELHVRGVDLAWNRLVPGCWKFVDLPKQQLAKSEFWAESEESRHARLVAPVHPLLGQRLRTATPTWQIRISAESPRFLSDHRIDGSVVFPAAGYVELMLAAAREHLVNAPWELENINFRSVLILSSATAVVETSLEPERGRIEVVSRLRGAESNWNVQASARVRAWSGKQPCLNPWHPKIEPPRRIDRLRFYRTLAQVGHEYGPAFQGLQTIWGEDRHVLGIISLPPAAGSAAEFLLHPALLDACFQVMLGIREFDVTKESETFALPISIERIRFFRRAEGTVFARAELVGRSRDEVVGNIAVIDDTGYMVVEIYGMHCRLMPRAHKREPLAGSPFYKERWIEVASSECMARRSEAPSSKVWLILADHNGVADRLVKRIAERGDRSILVHRGSQMKQLDDSCFEVSTDLAQLKQDLQSIIATVSGVDGVVHLWPLDRADAIVTADEIKSAQDLGMGAVIALVQALAAAACGPRIFVVTPCSAEIERDCARKQSIAQSSLSGAIRSLGAECPALRPKIIDVDPQTVCVDSLANEILLHDAETEIALRGRTRYACRLERISETAIPFSRRVWDARMRSPPFHLTMSAPGVIDNLVFRETKPREPSSSEVLIEVHAVGLNFRDVVAATGVLPAQAEDEPAWQNLGLECAGIVRAVGDIANANMIGHRVVAMTRGCFASHAYAPAALTFVIPDGLAFQTAAAIPVAYATAQYSLVTLGRVRAGDTILIHAAAGGVGLAAVEIARKHGAQIIATAGTTEKRSYLADKGVQHVLDSRSLSFADEVMRLTGDRGLDIVLNSLPGAFLEKSLGLLAPGGRFLEIGKNDVYSDKPIGLHQMRHNAALFVIDLARLAFDRPQILRDELKALFEDLRSGRLGTLPVEIFPLCNVTDAFRHMAKAKHIGKIVISYDTDPIAIETSEESRRIIREDAAYLVTGGLAGFGLAAAHWLVDQGARALVLVGRSGASSEAQAAIDKMCNAGARVAVIAADVSRREGIALVHAQVEQLQRPLRGIIHAAGVIDDALVTELDSERMARVFDGKVLGAWHLHESTRNMSLDFFVCLSSTAGVLGSIGQVHYAAANRVLDAIAAMRHAEGLPCMSIAWGPISGVGYLARHPNIARNLEKSGVAPIAISDALRTLGELLRRNCASVAVANIDWSRLGHANPSIMSSPRTAPLIALSEENYQTTSYLRDKLLATPRSERLGAVASFVRDQICEVLRVAPELIELDRPLNEVGLDSLTSFELRNRLQAGLGATLPVGQFLRRPTVNDLASAVLEDLDAPVLGNLRSGAPEASSSTLSMSMGQEALWLADRLAPGSPAYGLAMCVAVGPHGKAEHLANAFPLVIARHECLRLAFPSDGMGPLPKLVDLDAFKMDLIDVTQWDEMQVRQELDRRANAPFDLEHGPLVRLHVFQRKEDHIVLLYMHHIVSDAASIAIITEELFEAYFALRAGQPVRWLRPAHAYSNYVAWQKGVVAGPHGDMHQTFWREQLAGAPSELTLHTDYPRPPSQRGPGAAQTFVLPVSMGLRINQLAHGEGTTLFAVLLSAFKLLVHRLSGDTDIVVGTPASVRTQPEFEDVVGYLVNAVPIRTRLDTEQSFRQLLANVDATVRTVLEHQEYPFARIVEDIDFSRDSSRSPIFQVMFGMERSATIDSRGFAVTLLNIEGASLSVRDLTLKTVALQRDRAQFDLAFSVEELDGKIYGVVDYRADLWHATTIARFIQHYETILQHVADFPERVLSQFALGLPAGVLLGPRLNEVSDICEAVRRTGAAAPARVAIEAKDGCWTYGELVARSGRLAAALAAHGITPNTIVGICLGRGRDLIPALLAVLELGAAFVPIEASHPPARVNQVLADTRPALIIGDQIAADALERSDCRILSIDEILDGPSAHPPPRPEGDTLAYVLHTSGSTGSPLGVEVSRAALSNLIAAMRRELPIGSSNVWLAIATTTFDASLLELLLILAIGGRLVIADEAMTRDGRLLAARLGRGDITVMQATPATWQMLIDSGWRGSAGFTALSGGEALHRPLADALLDRVSTLWNEYGPTEATINATCARVERGPDPVSIGSPIANTACYVLDESGTPVAVGVPGELVIGGRGIARGYRNDPERTEARFVPDPFDTSGKGICFRTGDFVRVSESGSLIYLGRRDQQVKIRGFRVELGDLEATLAAHPAVRSAVAVVHGSDIASRRIAAYVVLDPAAACEEHHLKAHLHALLPSYMVPATITIEEALPRLPSGKFDRGALARCTPICEPAKPVTPSNPIEEKLLSILKDVLGIDHAGLDEDFFALGGTSLLGLRYIVRTCEVFAIDLGTAELMHTPTVRGLAQRIAAGQLLSSPHASAGDAAVTTPLACNMWRPLALARAEGAFEKIDAAAITYLPDELLSTQAFHRLRGAPEARAAGPHWMGACRTQIGTIALLVAPLTARDLIGGSSAAKSTLDSAVAYAARLGADCISLTGLIPAVTNLGRDLACPDDVALTTGHACTASAMALTIQSAAAATGRDLEEETLSFVGLGAIGSATLRVLLECVAHPRALILCDLPGNLGHLQLLAREARTTLRFQGSINVVTATTSLPKQIYDADFLIAATNAPKIIQVERLRPGTIVVDYSFPWSFDFDQAMHRFGDAGDILVATGGSIRLQESIDWTFMLPPELTAFTHNSIFPPSTAITGCILSSLLPTAAGVAATLGEVTIEECRDHWNAMATLGIDAAPLHCGSWIPNHDDITRFRAIGAKRT